MGHFFTVLVLNHETPGPGGKKKEEAENPEQSRLDFSVGDMKKLVSVLLLTAMVLGSAGVYASNDNVMQDEGFRWPRFRINWHITVMINMKSYLQDCEAGDGLCFFIGFSQDEILAGEKMPAEVGPTDDGRFLAVKVDFDALERYEEGNYVYRFKNKRSIYIPQDIYFPDEVWKKMGMEPVNYKAGSYSIACQDGAYYLMFPLQ